MKSLRSVLSAIRKADQRFNLINDGDKIMVGISGGKDSIALLYALNLYKMFSLIKFEVYPATIDLGFPGFPKEEIKEYVKELGYDLTIIDSHEVYDVLKDHKKDGKNLPCSICSRMKKASINKAANDLGCNKVAFAHHADDAMETLLMNEIYGGRYATFEPKMHLKRANITFIRPLILVRESQIRRMCEEEGLKKFSSHCPNDGYTQRTEIKSMLDELYKKYPMSKDNFLHMLTNYKNEASWSENLFYKIEKTNLSLKPVISKDDALIDASIFTKANKKYKENDEHYIIYKKNKPIGTIKLELVSNNLNVSNFYLLDEKSQIVENIVFYLENGVLFKDIFPYRINILDTKRNALYKKLGYKNKTQRTGLSKDIRVLK